MRIELKTSLEFWYVFLLVRLVCAILEHSQGIKPIKKVVIV